MKPIREDRHGRPRDTGSSAKPHRVLLIEDHPSMAEATADFLQFYGLEVRIASTGEEALGMVSAFQPEIVLCDVNLPDMTGLDVARALRAIPDAKSALIVIHTAMTEGDLRLLGLARDMDASVNMFLSKPLTDENLCVLLSKLEVLQRSQGRRPGPNKKLTC